MDTITVRQYFGTDGIRGEVGQFPITPEFILKLGWAAGRVLAPTGGKILIGKDTRISGYLFESALEAGLSAAGVDIQLLGPMPTPAIAYLTCSLRAQGGIVISASHNPYTDNGIKFFAANGNKICAAQEAQIEQYLAEELITVNSAKLGKAKRITDAAGRYVEFCKASVGTQFSLKGFKLVVDCANGAAYQIAPQVFSELGAEVIPLAIQPDGLNINANCGSTHPRALQEAVLAQRADAGIALDGDGDRVIMVDQQGELLDGDSLLWIMAKYAYQQDTLQGGVVGTVMSNIGLELALQQLGIAFKRAAVGDRYVLETLQTHNWQLGGEASGHIIHLGLSSTGDGIIAALQVLAAMYQQEESLYQLKQGLLKYPQVLINVRVANSKLLLQQMPIQQAVQACQAKLGGQGRILLRPSGTEPLIRIMVEGEQQAQIESIANELAEIIKQAASYSVTEG